jgi:hypothetical protein
MLSLSRQTFFCVSTQALWFIVLILLILPHINANISDLVDLELGIHSEKVIMWSLNETPAGHDQPYIRVTGSVFLDPQSNEGSVDCAIYPYRLSANVANDEKVTCCTEEIVRETGCKLGSIVIVPDPNITFVTVSLNSTERTRELFVMVNITESGPTYVLLVHCPLPSSPNSFIYFTGSIEYRNPYGYLPGNMFPLLHVAGVMSLAYILVLLPFLVLMWRHRKELLRVQQAIALVTTLGVIEMGSWWLYYLVLNRQGHHVTGAMVLALFMSNFKKTVSRVLLLLVSMGFGLVKWTLGTTKYKIGGLALLYFCFSLAFEIMEYLRDLEGNSGSSASDLREFIVVVGVVVLDTCFLWWIFLSIIRTIQQLTLRRQTLKLRLYKRFFWVLCVAAAIAVIVVLYQLFVSVVLGSGETQRWRSWWVWTAFWQFFYFVLLTIVAWLLRPRQNNMRYGYAEMYDETSDDPATQLQTIPVATAAFGDVSQRSTSFTAAREADDAKKSSYDVEREHNIKEASTQAKIINELASFTLSDEEEDMHETERNKLQ